MASNFTEHMHLTKGGKVKGIERKVINITITDIKDPRKYSIDLTEVGNPSGYNVRLFNLSETKALRELTNVFVGNAQNKEIERRFKYVFEYTPDDNTSVIDSVREHAEDLVLFANDIEDTLSCFAEIYQFLDEQESLEK